MAVSPVEVLSGGRQKIFKWTLTSADDVANPTPPLDILNDQTVQVYGTTDANGWNTATIQLQGSIAIPDSAALVPPTPPAQYVVLNDPQGNAISIANTNKVEAILEHMFVVKPVKSAGDFGADGVTIWLMATATGP